MQVLTVNAGSSSLKLRVLDPADSLVGAEMLPAPGGRFDEEELRRFLSNAPGFDAVGHRFVHGGARFREAVPVTDAVVEALSELDDLAPLHNRHALDALAALRRLRHEVPEVACFDTSFHAHLPPAAAVYALPWDWTERLGVRRYGFHGLSHAHAARRAAELCGGDPESLRVVTCHLGAGTSLAAVDGGASIDTTMGFTPNEGLPMATRSGSVDPGALLWLQRREGIDAERLEHVLEHESGLVGISGVSADMRELLAAAGRGDERARLAIDVYLHRLRAGIASMAAAMGGLDALVFTGGVGEGSAEVRHRACAGLRFLGVRMDDGRNDAPGEGDADVSAPGSDVRVLVVHAREDLEIAAEVRRLLGSASEHAEPPWRAGASEPRSEQSNEP